MKRILVLSLVFLVVSVSSIFAAGEVAIYTGLTQWILKPAADKHADKYVQLFEKAKIKVTWFKSDKDGPKVADWVKKTTSDNVIDALILFGDIPPFTLVVTLRKMVPWQKSSLRPKTETRL